MPDVRAETPEAPAEVQADRVVVGTWSKPLAEVSQEAVRLRALLAEGRAEETRREMMGRSVEERTALVLVSPPETREELLSLTGPDGRGYSPAVVDRLPTEALVDLLAVDSDYLKHNVEILRAMSPERFGRAVAETMEPVYYWEDRQRVAWEWLEAAAAVEDVAHRTRLLTAVNTELIEDALFSIVAQLDLGGVVAPGVKRFRLFSESGLGGPPPSTYIEDPHIGEVLNALHEATPDLFKQAIRAAWERFGESVGAEDIDEDADELES